MQNLEQHCCDTRPNITYVAIGSAYTDIGGYQQHPPFLERMIDKYTNFTFQVILIDPMIENPPECSVKYRLKIIDSGWYGNDKIDLRVIRELFNYDSLSLSYKLLSALIMRTITAKKECSNNTYLLFVHDFSGNEIHKLAYEFDFNFSKQLDNDWYIYKNNIMIDINNRIDAGCFVDLFSFFCDPITIENIDGSLNILNPFLLDNEEIIPILKTTYNTINIHQLITNAINNKLDRFFNFTLNIYDQLLYYCYNYEESYPVLPFGKFILKDIQILDKKNASYVMNIVTKNLIKELEEIAGFINFIDEKMFQNIFGDFIAMCQNPNKIFAKISQILMSNAKIN